jgi:hypothetical protein
MGRLGEHAIQRLDAFSGLFGAGFQEFKELVIFTEEFLQGKHSEVFVTRPKHKWQGESGFRRAHGRWLLIAPDWPGVGESSD